MNAKLKPRVTLVLFSYNQERYVDMAARSVLMQECEPIEILMSDDCSQDGTYARLEDAARTYSGPHHVVVRRNEKNYGIGEHVNTVLSVAQGRLLVFAAADDVSLPNRVARTLEVWDRSNEKLDLIASHVFDMTSDGEDVGVIRVDSLQDWKSVDDWIRARPYVVGAGHAISRRVFERFGPFQSDVMEEDQINTFRALCCGGAYTIDEPLVRYRRGGLSTGIFTPLDYRAFELRRSRRHLAGVKQLRQDAAKAGFEEEVVEATDWSFQRALFVNALSSSPTLWSGIKLAANFNRVDPMWRAKTLVKNAAPRLAFAARRFRK